MQFSDVPHEEGIRRIPRHTLRTCRFSHNLVQSDADGDVSRFGFSDDENEVAPRRHGNFELLGGGVGVC